MRINARLDEDHRRKLEYLVRSTGSRVSDIVKQAIDLLYANAKQAKGRARALLTRSGFVGCGEASEDLSLTYKDELKESMRAKHGHR
ncbi:MAG: CopG family transcriptional regulator [Woeseia sp.]